MSESIINPAPNSSTFSVIWPNSSVLSYSGEAKDGLQTGVINKLFSLLLLNLEIPKSINLI